MRPYIRIQLFTAIDLKLTVLFPTHTAGTLCYFSALRRCCSGASDNVQLGEAREVQVGSQMVTVRYLYSGGFGSSDPLRKSILGFSLFLFARTAAIQKFSSKIYFLSREQLAEDGGHIGLG